MNESLSVPPEGGRGRMNAVRAAIAGSRRTIAVLLVVQFLLAGGYIGTRVLADQRRPRLLDASGARPTVPGPYVIETGFDAARQQAELWATGAELMAVGMQIDWPGTSIGEPTTTVPPGGWLTYVFVAPVDRFGSDSDAAALTLFVERTTGVIYDQREITWPAPAQQPIDLATYPVSSSTAVLASELAAGAEHRRGCPQFRNETRVGLARDPTTSTVSWVVTYPDSRYGQSGLTVTIDATTGDMASIEDRSFSCETE